MHAFGYGASGSFLDSGISLPGVGSGVVAWGDYDGDGDLDLLVAGATTPSNGVAQVWRNDALAGFTLLPLALPPLASAVAAWGDYDRDGDLDFVVAGHDRTNFYTRIYRNDGGGSFTDVGVNLPGCATATLAWGDYDNDGDLDLLLAGETAGSGFTKVFRNDGSDHFTDMGANLFAISYGTAAWIDYDNDGDLDIMLSGGDAFVLYRNSGGIFIGTSISLSRIIWGSAAAEDYDNDGDWDLLLTGNAPVTQSRYAPSARLYRNNLTPTSTFTLINTSLPGVLFSAVAWGDYDADGLSDVLISGSTESNLLTVVYRNAGGNNFVDAGLGLIGVRDGSVAWGDYDGDGDLDFVFAGNTGSNAITRVYQNLGGTNPRPAAPSNLVSSVWLRGAVMNWAAASDSNQIGGLTYNLRVSTTPDKSDIVAPMSDPVTGVRSVPRSGNAGLRNTWLLTNLAVGTYYWSVQTIDHGFAGSGFAPLATFVIPPEPPMVMTLDATGQSTSGAFLNGKINPNGLETAMWFEYGLTTNYGLRIALGSANTNQAIGLSTTLSNLAPATTYYYRLVGSNALGLVTGSSLTFATTLFQEMAAGLPGISDGSIDWGDYDNDGDLDLLVSGTTTTNTLTRIFRNEGNGTLVEVDAGLPGIMSGAARWGDYDQDGDLDILLSGVTANTLGAPAVTRVFRNNGADHFVDINAGLPATGIFASASWVDFDNDGDLDIVLMGGNPAAVFLYANQGSGSFVQVSNALPAYYHSPVVWGDFDSDGDWDAAIIGSGGVRFFRNLGTGFQIDSPSDLLRADTASLAVADHNNDGFLDLVLSGTSNGDRIGRVYRHGGVAGTLQFNTNFAAVLPVNDSAVAWADYDNDGDVDVAICGYDRANAVTRIYRNEGGYFVDSGAKLAGVYSGALAWGDFDQDGVLDLAISGRGNSSYLSQVYRGLVISTNIRPSAPTNLLATATNDTITFTWATAADGNQTGGFSYNLRLGTAPGTANLMSPQADFNTGRRLVLGQGNTSLQRRWSVRNLDVGTYYWSVQTIDHGFAGSTFSPEQVVVIPPRVPRALTGLATNVNVATSRLAGEVNPGGASATYFFQYGTTTNFGKQTPPENSGNGTKLVPVSGLATGLVSETSYYYRLIASNGFGLSIGSNRTFTTLPPFSEGAVGLPTLHNWNAVAWADQDNDDDQDFVITGFLDQFNRTQIYRNDGPSGFNLQSNPELAGVALCAVAWGDYDGDGDVDLFVAGAVSSANVANLYRNDGGGRYTDIGASFPPVGSPLVAWIDFDNDGDLDLFLAGLQTSDPASSIARFYRNDEGIFRDMKADTDPVNGGSTTCGDFDNDGDRDLLVTGFGTNAFMTRLYRNDGAAGFARLEAGLPPIKNGTAVFGDMDNDGDLDVFLAGETTNGYVTRIYAYQAGTYTPLAASFPGVMGASISCVDFDQDGLLDFVLTGSTNGSSTGALTHLYRNLGGGNFVLTRMLRSMYAGATAWGDMDGDSDPDLLLSGVGTTYPFAQVVRNESAISNPPPAIPTNLMAAVDGSSVNLSWAPVTDANQTGGLNYNLRVGTSPGLGDILPPHSSATGWRRLSARGNAGQTPGWHLSNLRVGTYYWSVQAVDHGFSGSGFGAEGSFVIEPRIPSVSTEPATNVQPHTAVLTGVANANGLPTFSYFEYGIDTNYGSTTAVQNLGNGVHALSLTGMASALTPGTTYHFRLAASNAFGVAVGVDRLFASPVFTWVTNISINYNKQSIAWGDYDNDGDLDVLTVSGLYRNQGSVFVNSGISASWSGLGESMAWGDYDNDGDLDMLLPTKIYRNNGNGTFTDLQLPLTFMQQGDAQWVDFDNDGRLDFFRSGLELFMLKARLYRNMGGGAFAEVATTLPAVLQSTMAWGDFDNDGDPDLLIGGATSSNICRVYRNDGGGVFTDVEAGLPGIWEGMVGWEDCDNDGDLDIMLTGGITKIYRNDGGGVFTDSGAVFPALTRGGAAWGDYDGDGATDFIVAGWTNTSIYESQVLRIYRNNRDGNFYDSGISLPAGGGGAKPVFLDFDRDGRLDLGLSSGPVLRNYFLATNTPPSAPTNLTAVVTSNSVSLNWTATVDANQTGGHTYNLRVGTGPGRIDVVSPHSDVTNGFRRIVGLGNAYENLRWNLRNLAPGRYYWSVQAIDHSFAGSPFAGEEAFVVGTPRWVETKLLTNGLVSLRLSGLVGQTYVVETSGNLSNWVMWQSFILDTPSKVITDSPQATRKFYRARIDLPAQ